MAFQPNNLERISINTVAGLPQFWGYKAGNDTIATVSAGDYFKYFAESNTGLYNFKFLVGDQIYCVCSDGNVSLDVSAVSPDITTIVSVSPSAVMQSRSITQAAHGFVAQDILKFAGGVYAKAQANSLANSQVVGMVASVTSANEFVLVYGGYVTGLSGFVANTTYYLSASSAGALTGTEPSTAGQVSRPLFIATSATAGYFFLGRSNLISSADTDTALSQAVAQGAHGFVVGDAIYASALNTYAKAQANSLATSQVVGVVATVVDAGNFTYVSSGAIAGLAGLTSATPYYLSAGTAGLLTSTAPTAAGQFVVSVLDSISTTAGFVNVSAPLPAVAGVTAGGTGVATLTTAYGTLVAGTTATGAIQTVAPGTSGQVLISAGAASVPAYGVATVPGGGTGVATLTTAYGTVCAGTTATGALQTVSPGTAGHVLTSNGAAALPTYQAASGGSLSYPPTNTAQKAAIGGYRICSVPGLFSSVTLSDSQTALVFTPLADQVIFIPYFSFQATSFTQIRIYVVTGAGASSVTAGYYACDANGLPTGSPVVNGSVATTSSASGAVISVAQTLSANTLYWYGIQASTGTTLAIATSAVGLGPGISVDAPAATISQWWMAQTNTYSAGTLPAIGTLVKTSSYMPQLPVLWLV